MNYLFDRYGSPGQSEKTYKDFADWYLKQFSGKGCDLHPYFLLIIIQIVF